MFEWLMDLANETSGFIDDSFYKLEMWIRGIAKKFRRQYEGN
jgi:hypothetical protein